MKAIPYFDTHCDTISFCEMDGRRLRKNSGHVDLERMSEFRKAVQFFAMFHDLRIAPTEGMFSMTQRQQAVFAREMTENADLVVQCTTAAEINAAHAAGKTAAVLTCEGTEMLNCDPEKLEWAKSVGVAAIGLTWNHANLIAGSHLHEPTRGLNDLGREFVRQTQKRDILIDVSHCSDAAFWDLMKITTKPVIASHSNSRSFCSHTRNITDDMFRAIMETGGVVGLNYWVKFLSDHHGSDMDLIIRHFDHFMEMGGEKHVGLGSDLDGCWPLIGDMQGIQDVPMLWTALRDHGYSEELLEDIFFNNFMRVMN